MGYAWRLAGIPPGGISLSSHTGFETAMTVPVLLSTSVRTKRDTDVSTEKVTEPPLSWAAVKVASVRVLGVGSWVPA